MRLAFRSGREYKRYVTPGPGADGFLLARQVKVVSPEYQYSAPFYLRIRASHVWESLTMRTVYTL